MAGPWNLGYVVLIIGTTWVLWGIHPQNFFQKFCGARKSHRMTRAKNLQFLRVPKKPQDDKGLNL